MPEQWKDIPGFDGRYQASSEGRIRSVVRGKVHDLHLKPHRDGYPKFNAGRDGRVYTIHVHVAVAMTFLGPKPRGYFVDHIDRDHANNAVSNLRYLSPSESNANRAKYGEGRQHTGVECVYRHGKGGYFARLERTVCGQRIRRRLGTFTMIEAASRAVARAKELIVLAETFDVCPCGSGKAFKACCMPPIKLANKVR